MDIRDLIISLILGFVEGMTEFAPVSSTGHMIIIDDMLLKSADILGSTELANTFKVVIQFGSIIAVIIVFWPRLLNILGLSFQQMNDVKNEKRLKLSHIIIGLIPAVIFGLLFEDFIDTYFFRIETVLIALIAGAILMIVADRHAADEENSGSSLDEITYLQAFFIGLYQCIALWPGFSRSGATISGGVLMGLSHRAAADFTFIMAIPIMLGASVLSLYKKWDVMVVDVLPFFIIGFFSAFIFALVSIRFFLILISKVKLMPFALYRIFLAFLLALIYFSL